MSVPASLGLVALAPAVAGVLALGVRAARASGPALDWTVTGPSSAPETLQDPRLWALERMVAGHLESRHASGALATELRRLADRRLVLRHGLRIEADPARAAALLGDDLVGWLTADPPQRIRLDQVDRYVARIGAL